MMKINELEHESRNQDTSDLNWIPVLMYHHVVPRRHPGLEHVEVTIDEFEDQMKFLRDQGYEPIHLDETARTLAEGKDVAARPVVITFDDGYLDVFLHAFPILKKYQFTADLFLVSSCIDESAHHSPSSAIQAPLLRAPEIKEMARYGISFGSHSVSHRRLATLSYQEAWEEIHGSKIALERLLGVPISSFSFPHGCSSPTLQEMVKEAGYLVACGIEQREHTLYNLSRIDAARCRGADLRWRLHTSGLYFRLRQSNSLRMLKDFFSRLWPGWNRDGRDFGRYTVDDLLQEREQT